MAIKKPSEMNFADKNIVMIISGLPGTGKTTLALSAPDVLLIDADEGMCRVNAAHRRDSSISKTYEEVLEDIKSAEGVYKTIVIDTAGALIDYMKDWVVRNPSDFPKGAKNSGGISLVGFGYVKQEFLRLSAELRKKFNVVFLFHESMTKSNDDILYELVCEGSARTLVYQPADLAAHLFIQNGTRYLGFTPTEQYTAKSAYGIRGLIEVPELKDGEDNNFLTKLFAKVRKNLAAESADLAPKNEAYKEAIQNGLAYISNVNAPEDVKPCMEAIKNLDNALTSEKEITAALKKRMKDLGIVYDKTSGEYKYADK